MKNGPCEDAFPIENGDIPLLHVGLVGETYTTHHQFYWPSSGKAGGKLEEHSTWKWTGWNTSGSFFLGETIFRGKLAVSFTEYITKPSGDESSEIINPHTSPGVSNILVSFP